MALFLRRAHSAYEEQIVCSFLIHQGGMNYQVLEINISSTSHISSLCFVELYMTPVREMGIFVTSGVGALQHSSS